VFLFGNVFIYLFIPRHGIARAHARRLRSLSRLWWSKKTSWYMRKPPKMTSDSDVMEDEQEETEALFRQGHHTNTLPVVAQLQGSTLRALCNLQDRVIEDWLQKALTTATRASHRRTPRWIAEMPQEYSNKRAAIAVLENLRRLRRQQQWTWSTTLKYAATTGSALRLLPTYKATTHGLQMSHDTFWTQGLEHLRKCVREEKPRTPMPMTLEVFTLTMAAESETLTQFSGHLREKTLLRYASWGRMAKAQHSSMAEAGALLFRESN
jgi:hypothetical protein